MRTFSSSTTDFKAIRARRKELFGDEWFEPKEPVLSPEMAKPEVKPEVKPEDDTEYYGC